MSRLLTWAILFLLLGVLACSSEVDLEAPPELIVGEDICAQCGMIISEEAYAAGYRLGDGRQKVFDDIGDMVAHHRQNREDVYAFWVHDFNTAAWIRAESAFFVESSGIVTPMGHGVVAFADDPAARTLADAIGGEVMSFDELLTP